MIKGLATAFLFLIVIQVSGQPEKIPMDTIVSRFLKGDMIVINKWALAGPTDFFDTVRISPDLYNSVLLDKDSAIVKYGYFGEKIRIYELVIPSIDSISYGDFVDAKVFKYLNPEKEIFYFINGAPCWDHLNALDLIVNKKIIEIKKLGANQATAIWGQKDGKNGALIINTNRKPNSIVIFK